MSSPTAVDSLLSQLMEAKVNNLPVVLRAVQEHACASCKEAGKAMTCDHLARELAVDFKSKHRQQKIDALMAFDMMALLNESRGVATECADAWFSPAFMHRLVSLKFFTWSEFVVVPVIMIGVDPNASARNPQNSECAMCAIAYTLEHGFVVSVIIILFPGLQHAKNTTGVPFQVTEVYLRRTRDF